MSLFNKGSKPYFLTVIHYAGGRRRKASFLQVLVMSMCWTEWPEEQPLQGTNFSSGPSAFLLDALQLRQLNLALEHCTNMGTYVSSSLFSDVLGPVGVCWARTRGTLMMDKLSKPAQLSGKSREKMQCQQIEPISDLYWGKEFNKPESQTRFWVGMNFWVM